MPFSRISLATVRFEVRKLVRDPGATSGHTSAIPHDPTVGEHPSKPTVVVSRTKTTGKSVISKKAKFARMSLTFGSGPFRHY